MRFSCYNRNSNCGISWGINPVTIKFEIMKSFSWITLIAIFISFTHCRDGGTEFDASGVFESEETIVSAEVGGKVLQWEINEGMQLSAGTVVGSIDCKPIEIQKQQVEASIEALNEKQVNPNPQKKILRQQLKAQNDQIEVMKEQLAILLKEENRTKNLVEAEAIPVKKLDDISGQIKILQKQILTAESQIQVIHQQITAQGETAGIQNRAILSEAKPLLQKLAQIEDQISRCQITNPVGGTVLVKYIELNEMAALGKPLYKIGDLQNMILRAYITGSQFSKAQLNQEVKISVDSGKDGYREYQGTISWISDEAEFTPKTIQTKEERANLVYAVKITVKNDGFLKIGMYGEVTL